MTTATFHFQNGNDHIKCSRGTLLSLKSNGSNAFRKSLSTTLQRTTLRPCTLQLLLGLPELLQLREILVQYEHFGETEGSHFRRSWIDLV